MFDIKQHPSFIQYKRHMKQKHQKTVYTPTVCILATFEHQECVVKVHVCMICFVKVSVRGRGGKSHSAQAL